MRKVNRFMLFCLLLSLIIFMNNGVWAEGPVITDSEELLSYLKSSRSEAQSGAETLDVEFSCSEDLYSMLRDRDFRELFRMMIRAGFDPDIWFSYSDETRSIRISAPDFIDMPWADCESEEQIRQFLSSLTSYENGFIILCSHDLMTQLQDNHHLDWIAAQNGIDYMSLWYSSKADYYQAEDIEKFEIPYAVVENYAEFSAAVSDFAGNNIDEFNIVFTPELYEKVTTNDAEMKIMTASSKLMRYGASINDGKRIIEFYGAEYTDAPREVCRSIDDVSSSILRMGALGVSDFELIFPDIKVYEMLSNNDFKLLSEIESKCGVVSVDISYSSRGSVYFTNAEISQSAVMLQTLSDAIVYTADQISEGKTDIHLFCTPELYRKLLGDLTNVFKIGRRDLNPISDLIAHNGISDYDITSIESTHLINIHINHFYPGTAILKAVQTGDSSSLTSREMETWKAARTVADSVKNLPPLEQAQKIHDWICEHVVYTKNDTNDEKDNAIGAILNGEADCDGYSDAFFLIAGLAGLNVRYQHGNSLELSALDSLSTETHMWNLLEIDGVWHMVDVTWDDDEDGVTHGWFNVGFDIAERIHIWNKEMSVDIAPVTERIVHSENEFYVRNEQELRNVVDHSSQQKFPVFFVIFEDPSMIYLSENAIQYIGEKVSDSFYYSRNDKIGLMKFNDLHWN